MTKKQPGSDNNEELNVGTYDRRQHPRRESSEYAVLRFEIAAMADSAWSFRLTPMQGDLIDLSIRGCAFETQLESDVVIVKETRLGIELRPSKLEDRDIRQAVVVRTRELDHGRLRVFCRFDQELSLDDLSQFGRYSFPHDVV